MTAIDDYAQLATALNSPYRHAAAVSPSDTVDLADVSRALFVLRRRHLDGARGPGRARALRAAARRRRRGARARREGSGALLLEPGTAVAGSAGVSSVRPYRA